MARNFGIGTGDRVETANYAAINNLAQFTIAAWTYRTAVGGGGTGNARILSKVTGANAEWNCYMNNTAGTMQLDCQRWNTTTGVWRGVLVGLNTWAHIGWTYSFSSTANNAIMYLNGVAQSTSRTTAPAGTAATVTGADFAIGNVAGGTAAREWPGRIMHACLWNRILSAGELMGVYKTGPANYASGLLCWYPLFGTASPEPNYAPQGDATRNGVVTGTTTGGANDAPGRSLFWS